MWLRLFQGILSMIHRFTYFRSYAAENYQDCLSVFTLLLFISWSHARAYKLWCGLWTRNPCYMFVPGSTEDSRLVAEAYREYLTEPVWKNVWNKEMFEINVWNKLFSMIKHSENRIYFHRVSTILRYFSIGRLFFNLNLVFTVTKYLL